MNHHYNRELREVLYKALVKEMDNRRNCPGMEWVDNERNAVVAAANRWTIDHGSLLLITADDVERIEVQACGHVDYASKLCLYVAEFIAERDDI